VEFDGDALGITLAGVFAGLAVLLAVVALVKQPFVLLAALPFAAAAYLVWMGATGRTPFGVRWWVSHAEARANSRQREPWSAQRRTGPEAKQRRRGGTRTRRRSRQSDALARREAARVLGVDVDAEPAAVRRAYRESVKEAHPDTEGGDEEAFHRVNEAYERLQEE